VYIETFLLVGALISTSLADVGFNDSQAYLAVKISDSGNKRSFSLSEKAPELADINLQSQKQFAADKLQALFDAPETKDELRYELSDMLSGSFLSAHKSREFLEELTRVLARYSQSE